eukprot:CAMPEP_0115002984 /NCGR_PEP_ID=MMETSP0216-20121206/18326_1 /TAXON_ID=223996 /ORGANISM="Protocruzia adherens, Strain Boccale" /LENGTH=41 /DNA_ID= /DNA_START= /DNA_END= /DNA_ORIENTATION=
MINGNDLVSTAMYDKDGTICLFHAINIAEFIPWHRESEVQH